MIDMGEHPPVENVWAELAKLRALSQNNAHSWDIIVRERDELRADNERLRALLHEAWAVIPSCPFRDRLGHALENKP